MKTALYVYASFIAGVLAAAGVAYWYYAEHFDHGE